MGFLLACDATSDTFRTGSMLIRREAQKVSILGVHMLGLPTPQSISLSRTHRPSREGETHRSRIVGRQEEHIDAC